MSDNREFRGAALAAAGLLCVLLAACGGGETCAEVAEHIEACLGEEARPVAACNVDRAEQILEQDCATVRRTAAAGKADGWWDGFMCETGFYSYCEPFGAEAGLEPMLGDWELVDARREGWSPGSVIGCPPQMRLERLADEQGRPGLGLRRIEEDGSTGYRVYDRADLININGGEDCETIDMSETQALKICHRTQVTDPGALEHRIWMGEKVGYKVKPLTWDSSSAFQRLSLEGERLVYEWEFDDEVADRCVFVRR